MAEKISCILAQSAGKAWTVSVCSLCHHVGFRVKFHFGNGKIAEGLVRVNGEIETRKRKKIVAGDVIEFEENIIRIELDALIDK